MSFSQDIRSSGNFQELFGKLRRRMNKAEVPKDDLETLQRHVNNMRTQIDWAELNHITDNVASNPIGPNDFIFEPDLTEVKIYNPFNKIYGNGFRLDLTLNGIEYDVIEIGDSNVNSKLLQAQSYHYEPFGVFNGTSDFVSQADAAPLDLLQFSVACWFKTDGDYNADDGMILNKGGFAGGAGTHFNYTIFFDATTPNENTLKAGFEEASGTGHFAQTPTDILYNDGNWHHVVVTYDQTIIRLYVDGEQEADNDETTTPETGTTALVIGKNANANDSYFKGNIDEVYVWNNDLTTTEVENLYLNGVVPQTGNIVYSNLFGGSGPSVGSRCYYAVPFGGGNWNWNVGFHPPQLRNVNSIDLNVGTNSNQFIYYDNFGTDFNFSAQNFSEGFWFYPTDVSSSGTPRVLAFRYVDASNQWSIEIDTDAKLFMIVNNATVQTKRQYDTPLTANTWFHVNITWQTAPTLSIKVNDNADTTSTKTTGITATTANLFFGSYPGATTAQDFKGYLCLPIYYKHSTVLTAGERTSLYNYGTKTSTTEPIEWGFAQFG